MPDITPSDYPGVPEHSREVSAEEFIGVFWQLASIDDDEVSDHDDVDLTFRTIHTGVLLELRFTPDLNVSYWNGDDWETLVAVGGGPVERNTTDATPGGVVSSVLSTIDTKLFDNRETLAPEAAHLYLDDGGLVPFPEALPSNVSASAYDGPMEYRVPLMGEVVVVDHTASSESGQAKFRLADADWRSKNYLHTETATNPDRAFQAISNAYYHHNKKFVSKNSVRFWEP